MMKIKRIRAVAVTRWIPRKWISSAFAILAFYIMCVFTRKQYMRLRDTRGMELYEHYGQQSTEYLVNHTFRPRSDSNGNILAVKTLKAKYGDSMQNKNGENSGIIHHDNSLIGNHQNDDGQNGTDKEKQKRSIHLVHDVNRRSNVYIPPVVLGNAGLGQNGTPVPIKRSQLNSRDKELWDRGYKRNDFNEYISDLISVDRTVPEVRDPRCLDLTYPTDLPDTSVIITFLNEAWSVLVRSVHSVINTSPPHLLREIILVDDFSEYAHLKEPLEIYMRKFPQVLIVRNEKREGLIRSRLNGAKLARGKVLTFLDSHIECATDWLPPLLSRIKQNVSHVVWPAIPGVDRHTFKFHVNRDASKIFVGGFNWKMIFIWDLPNVGERDTPTSPIKSPTMAGGLFSIDRNYFYHIGSYDDQMQFWGGENLEISFRIWMCGGTIEVIPCSLVGHVFRTRNVNSNAQTSGKSTDNIIRTALVWMDEYRHLYERVANVDLENHGDISSRIQLRKSLQCKSFSWYLDNVYSNIFSPWKATKSGLLHSGAMSSMCLKSVDVMGSPVKVVKCNSQHFVRQVFHETREEELRLLETCVDVGPQNPIMYPCHKLKGTQHMRYRKDHTLFSPWTGKCLEWIKNSTRVGLRDCSRTTRQMWIWEEQKFNL